MSPFELIVVGLLSFLVVLMVTAVTCLHQVIKKLENPFDWPVPPPQPPKTFDQVIKRDERDMFDPPDDEMDDFDRRMLRQ